MDIGRLKLFSDIADTKNLTLSADRMGYTQSGVSHAISKLEIEMGVPLLKRNNRGVELTKDGELLLPRIRSVIKDYKQLQDDIESIRGLHRGAVCVGSYSSIAKKWLPSVIRSFKKLHPNIAISIREGGIEEIETWMYEGSVDFGFLSWRKNQQFRFISLARDPLYAITSKQFQLPEDYGGVFPVTAFTNYPFIASETGVDSDVAATFEVAKVKPLTSFCCRDDHTIISMVGNDLGISVLPGMFIEGHDNNIQKIPLFPMSIRTLGIGIISEKHLSASAKAFVKVSKTTINKLVDT